MKNTRKQPNIADLRRAATLEDAIPLFNPLKSLDGAQLDHFYVDRDRATREQMRRFLETSDLARREPVKLLFTGHTGSGKSTELNKLCQELADQFFIVKVSTRHIVQPTDLTYVDIMLIAAMSLFKQATDQEIVGKTVAQTFTGAWEEISDFIRDRVFGSLPYRQPAEGLEVGAKVSYLVTEFEVKYRNEARSRDQIRQRLGDQLSEVLDRMNNLAQQVRVRTRRPVLFVFDDTDKPDPARCREIFFGHPTTLTSFDASAIYTFNIGLRHAREFNTFKDYFTRSFYLNNLMLKDRVGQRQAGAWEKMSDVLGLRAHTTILTDDAREELIAKSGGLLRSLIGMTQFAAVNALGRGATQIELVDVRRSVGELRNDFRATLTENDYTVLAARAVDKRVSGDGDIQELLQILALLQYNGDNWCDVHPVVEELLRERGKMP